VSAELASFVRGVHGLRPEWPRRVLAVAAEAELRAALRREGFALEARDALSPGEWPEHAFDGVWLGRFEATPELCRELFRVLHHGWARLPVEGLETAARWRTELLLERAGLRVVEAVAPSALIARTLLVTPKIGAGGLVFDERGRVLLCERADGRCWCIPGGYSDPDEPPERTAVREVREEIGLECEIDRLLGVYSIDSATGWRIVVFEFLMRSVGGEARETDETIGWGWFGEDELPERMLGNHRLRVGHAFAVRRGDAEPPFVVSDV
jgi:ADP-ribose pyrophosphatase YjhB (NUDIX family)